MRGFVGAATGSDPDRPMINEEAMPVTNKPEHSALLSIDRVAELLGTSPRHIRRLVAQRRIPHHKVGGLVRFRVEAIERWLADNERGPSLSDR
jgi:excisionase family DNA binding protein